MSDKPWAVKDPDEVKDYGIRWAISLAGQNDGDAADTLASSEWLISPEGLTVDSDTYNAQTGITTVWFSGGDMGATYACTNRVTTVGGRTYDLTKKLKIKSK